MYTYKLRTVERIKGDIEALTAGLAAAADWCPDLEDDLDSLYQELEEAEAAEQQPVREKYAPTGGLNIPLVCRAFGLTEAELDKWLGEEVT